MRKAGLFLSTLILLSGCSDNKEKIEGERIAVLSYDETLLADEHASGIPVSLPNPIVNNDWPQAGGLAGHAVPHLDLEGIRHKVFQTRVGEGNTSDGVILSTPVVSRGVVYTVDTAGRLFATDAKTGKNIWKIAITKDGSTNDGFSGGVCIKDRVVYVTTSSGETLAVSAKNGEILWRSNVINPVRSAPTVSEERVFVVTTANQLHCLDRKSGKRLWMHETSQEAAMLVSGSSPAVDRNVVIVPYTSGEVFALRVDNGHELWSESLSSASSFDKVSMMANICAFPVIDQNMVFIISHSGHMAALDMRTGSRIWVKMVGGVQTPIVSGDFVFVLTNNNQVICLMRETGLVRWVRQLPKYLNPKKNTGKISWSGPVLAGNRLLLAGTDERLLALSPTDGAIMAEQTLPNKTFLPPVVADKTVYLLSAKADLVAFK